MPKGKRPKCADGPNGQNALEGRVPQRAKCTRGLSAPKGQVPQREECPDGQGAQKSILPQREKSIKSLKGLNSEKRGKVREQKQHLEQQEQ